jgi:hypothetical protein
MIHGREPQASAADPFMASAYEVWKDIVSKKPAKHPIAHIAAFTAFATGFPGITNQTIDTTSFLNQIREDEMDPETKMQWARGILAIQDKGKRP